MVNCEYVLLLADIHANEAALREVVRDARWRYRKRGLSQIWFLGDLFGRGPEPFNAWLQLRDYRPKVAVVGNHDWGVLGRSRNEPGQKERMFNEADWKVILAHRQELVDVGLLSLNGDQEPRHGPVFDYLQALPVVHSPYPGMYLVHGGQVPAQGRSDQTEALLSHLVWDYVETSAHARYTVTTLEWLCAQMPDSIKGIHFECPPERPQVVLVGHSHRRILYREDLDRPQWVSPVELGHTYELHPGPGRPVVISPGSVGFSREHGDRDASYAVLCLQDQALRSVTFHTAWFDRKEVQAQMRDKSYPRRIVKYLELPGDTGDQSGRDGGAILNETTQVIRNEPSTCRDLSRQNGSESM